MSKTDRPQATEATTALRHLAGQRTDFATRTAIVRLALWHGVEEWWTAGVMVERPQTRAEACALADDVARALPGEDAETVRRKTRAAPMEAAA